MFAVVARAIVRFLQFVLAITIGGIYAHCLQINHDNDIQSLYAVVVAGIGAITCVVYCIPVIKSYLFFAWDLVLFILNLAIFGVYAKLFVHRADQDVYKGENTQQMKNMVWVDLIATFLWLLTGCYGLWEILRMRRAKTMYTADGEA